MDFLPKYVGCRFFIIFINLSLGFCASGNIWLTVDKDKKASLQFIKKEFKEKRRINLSFIQSSPAEETEFIITSLDVKIANIDTWEMEGGSFLYYSKPVMEKNWDCLLFTLNTSRDAKWFGYFNITEWSLTQFEKEAANRDDLARFNNLTDYIVWEIKMPGNIVYVKDYEPLGPDWWLSNHGNRKAILKIPARDILNSRRKFSTYEICSDM